LWRIPDTKGDGGDEGDGSDVGQRGARIPGFWHLSLSSPSSPLSPRFAAPSGETFKPHAQALQPYWPSLHLKDMTHRVRCAKRSKEGSAMEKIEDMPIAARQLVCLVLAALIVSAVLTLGTFSANAELNSLQRAHVTVEVA
jgi:hypothetical protein